jgi:hypothetical protein
LDHQFTWYIEKDDEAMVFAPQPKSEEQDAGIPPSLDLTISEEELPDVSIEGINEYGFGLWTRWTMNYPNILIDKADTHTLVRMTTTRTY